MESVKKTLRMKRQLDLANQTEKLGEDPALSSDAVRKVWLDDGSRWVDASLNDLRHVTIEDMMTGKTRFIVKIQFGEADLIVVTKEKDKDMAKNKWPKASVIYLPLIATLFDVDMKPQAFKDILFQVMAFGEGISVKEVKYG